MKTSETLNKAADVIEEHGWGRGVESMYGSAGVCVMGALFHAQHGRFLDDHVDRMDNYFEDVETCPAGTAMRQYLELGTWDPAGDAELWQWNDRLAVSEGAERVVEALRACAVIEASREREAAEVTA